MLGFTLAKTNGMQDFTPVSLASGGSRVWKGGFMRMCIVAITPPFDAHAHRYNESGL